MAKVLLINPSFSSSYGGVKASIVNPIMPTLGLATIAATAIEKNHKVEILDLSWRPYNFNLVKDHVTKLKPDIIGITATTPLMNQMRDISVLVKDVSKNILVMEFIGSNGKPEKTLLESDVDEDDYHQSIQIMTDLFNKAKLVHGDFSEYNIFKTKNGLKLFDLGSAIDLNHPKSVDFLKRDINNITNFFVKRGLTVENPVDIIARITK